MRILLVLALICSTGCSVLNPSSKEKYEVRKVQLERDINLLKLEIRKERLENALEEVEK